MESTIHLDDSTLESFSDCVRGAVLQPGDEGYDEARTVWNGMIDKHPAVVVRCTGTTDVMAAVDFAREQDLPVAVKSGGHHTAGHAVCDDGLVIDLSAMGDVRVDPEAQTARVGPGATWGDFDHETQAFGLSTPGAADPRTGVAGVTLGGGTGLLSRVYGLTVDNLLSVDVVTAEGTLVHASQEENPDLFWGLCGGGGNFGVVTSFEFELHEVGPELLQVRAVHPIDDAGDVLRHVRTFQTDAPDEVTCTAMVQQLPPEPPFPEEFHGETTVMLSGTYVGSVDNGRAQLEPLADFGEPILAAVEPLEYTAIQQTPDHWLPDGERYHQKSHFLHRVTDEAIDTIIEYSGSIPSQLSMIALIAKGGAIAEVDPSVTPFPHRDASWYFSNVAGWSEPRKDDESIEWAQEAHAAMAPFATGGEYVNEQMDDGPERIRAAYGENYERLVEVKNEWDPENLFRMNQNIEPTV